VYKHLHGEKILKTFPTAKDRTRANGWKRKSNRFKWENRNNIPWLLFVGFFLS